MNQAPAAVYRGMIEQPFDRTRTAPRHAIVHLLHLFGDVDVDRGSPIALATDCNPGTSPLTSLLLVLNMGATLFRLTVEECLRGVTVNAARALGRGDAIGRLAVGTACDLAIWEIERPADLVYRMSYKPLWRRVRNGR